jgi:hypothetical protein
VISIPGNALARVRGDDEPVLLMAVNMERGLCLHRDGSLSTPPLKDITINPMEVAYRFDATTEELSDRIEALGSKARDE